MVGVYGDFLSWQGTALVWGGHRPCLYGPSVASMRGTEAPRFYVIPVKIEWLETRVFVLLLGRLAYCLGTEANSSMMISEVRKEGALDELALQEVGGK